MKKLLYVLLIISLQGYSQVHVTYVGGFGTYSMKDLRNQQDEISHSFPVTAKKIDDFPGYFYNDFSLKVFTNENFYSGITLSYASTGGRIHYSDYSGEIRFDQRLKGYAIGPQVGWLLNPDATNSFLYFDLKVPVIFSNYQMDFFSRIGNGSDEESYTFTSLNLAAQPGFSFSRRVAGIFAVHATLGFNIDVYQGKLYFKEDDNAYLQDENGDEVHTSWTGLRTGIGISLLIPEAN